MQERGVSKLLSMEFAREKNVDEESADEEQARDRELVGLLV